MSTTTRKRLFTKPVFFAAACLIAVGAIFTVFQAQPVSADRLEDQINAAEAEIDKFEKEIEKLRQRGDSLQNALNTLAVEKSAIQARVDRNEAKREKILEDIEETKKQIARNQEVLGETVSELYVDSSMTPIEMLASSNSIGDYVDKQEYRAAVRDQLGAAITEIRELREKLDDQKVEVETVISDLETQKGRIAEKERERQTLLAKTRGEESRYQEQASERREEVKALRAEQAAAMAAAAAARGGGGPDFSGYSEYPFMDSSMAYDDNCIYYEGGSAADPWGYCKRQCTSYVAWRLAKDGKSGFSGLGHAVYWGTDNRDYRSAQRGDVLVDPVGGYGHVMYIEAVTDSGVKISQFNVPYDSGVYSEDFYTWADMAAFNMSLRRF